MRRHNVGLFEFLVKESDIPVADLFADAFYRTGGVLQQHVADIGVIRLSVNIYNPVLCTKFCIYFEKKGIMKALPDQCGRTSILSDRSG